MPKGAREHVQGPARFPKQMPGAQETLGRRLAGQKSLNSRTRSPERQGSTAKSGQRTRNHTECGLGSRRL